MKHNVKPSGTRKMKKLKNKIQRFPFEDSCDHPLLLNQPFNYMPIIHVLKNYLPWKNLRDLQLMNKSWSMALKDVFIERSEFYIEIETPLKRALVNRDFLDNSAYFRAYRYPMEEFRRRAGKRMSQLESAFPVSEDTPPLDFTSLTIHATMIEECEEVDRLLNWLKTFGTKVKRLTLYKPVLRVVHEPTLGHTSMIIRKKVFHKLLECFPSLYCLDISGSKLNTGSLASFMLTAVEDSGLYEAVEDLFRQTRNSVVPDPSPKIYSTIRRLKIREMFESEGTEEIIELLPNLEKLRIKFLEQSDPNERLHVIRRQNMLKNIKELELIYKERDRFFDRDSMYELSMMDFNCLESLRIDRISVENEIGNTAITYIIRLLEKVKDTLEKLEINCVNEYWTMGVRGGRFIEILSESIPTMSKLKYLRINTVSEETPQPLLQLVQRLPILEKLSFTHKFEMMYHYELHFLPDELYACESLRSLKLKSIDFVLDRGFFRRLHQFFPYLEALDVLIDCAVGTSLVFYFRQLSKLKELRKLRLRCNTLEERDFNLSISLLLYVGLESLIIENVSITPIRLSGKAVKSGFRSIPNLLLLQFVGFDDFKPQEKQELERTLGERNSRLSVILK